MHEVSSKQKDIVQARNYIYKQGEAEGIAIRKFDIALKEGNLKNFPNVSYHLKKKEARLLNLQKKLKEEMRKAHEEKLKQKREAIELINAKKLAEKGTLGAALATGATGNSEDIKSLKQEEDKKINFLTKELKAAMEEVRTAVEASKSARLKVATATFLRTLRHSFQRLSFLMQFQLS